VTVDDACESKGSRPPVGQGSGLPREFGRLRSAQAIANRWRYLLLGVQHGGGAALNSASQESLA
jgi:hypothetical protein